MGCSGIDIINPICQARSLVSGSVDKVATAAFGVVADEFAKVASDALSWLWGQLGSATTVDLTGAGFGAILEATGAIALVVTTILFLLQVIASALRHEPGGLLRALRGLLVSFLGAAFAVASIGVLLALVDALSDGIVEWTLHTNLQGLGEKLVALGTLSTMSPAATLLVALVLLASVVVVWGALMVRKLLVIVAAVFAPVAFSGASADVTRGWVRHWIELTVALVVSKLVLVVIFLTGLSVLDGAGQAGSGAGQSVTQLMVGTLLLLLGGLSPWMAVRMVHFAGQSFASLHGHAAVATAGAVRAVEGPQRLAATGQQLGRLAGAGVAAMGVSQRNSAVPRPTPPPASAGGTPSSPPPPAPAGPAQPSPRVP
ncbi:MAG TPA: hypothetical protein VMD59_18865 [Acidimicrobiales bacterium]|nr:hypothetical protein [Acidimicrobiales bacterium]